MSYQCHSNHLYLCNSVSDSSFIPPLIYAAMGSSRDIAIGPVAVVSLLLGSLLQNEVDHEKNKEEYLRLAFTATFFAGITQAGLGFLRYGGTVFFKQEKCRSIDLKITVFFRLGFLIDFLSHAAIVGFMGGAAITIALQQLKYVLGIRNFTKETDIVSVMESVWGSVHHGVLILNLTLYEEIIYCHTDYYMVI